jgi:hypothetical protein
VISGAYPRAIPIDIPLISVTHAVRSNKKTPKGEG